eukprot:GHVP01061363.1.p1 GENE.GHVP01061363.1~~GHVP01061363.1.p1  ORF type:complete len:771 (+),score=145.72 GHVP01061363.1:76-2313(+)
MENLDMKRAGIKKNTKGGKSLFGEEEEDQTGEFLIEEILEEEKDPLGQYNDIYLQSLTKQRANTRKATSSILLSDKEFSPISFIGTVYGNAPFNKLLQGSEYLKNEKEKKRDTMQRVMIKRPDAFFLAKSVIKKEQEKLEALEIKHGRRHLDVAKRAFSQLFRLIEDIYGSILKEREEEENARKRYDYYTRNKNILGFVKMIHDAEGEEKLNECARVYREGKALMSERNISPVLRKVWARNMFNMNLLYNKIFFELQSTGSLSRVNSLIDLLIRVDCNESRLCDFIAKIEDEFAKELARMKGNVYSIDKSMVYKLSYLGMIERDTKKDYLNRLEYLLKKRKNRNIIFNIVYNNFVILSRLIPLLSSDMFQSSEAKEESYIEMINNSKDSISRICIAIEEIFHPFDQITSFMYAEDCYIFVESMQLAIYNMGLEGSDGTIKEKISTVYKKESSKIQDTIWRLFGQEASHMFSVCLKNSIFIAQDLVERMVECASAIFKIVLKYSKKISYIVPETTENLLTGLIDCITNLGEGADLLEWGGVDKIEKLVKSGDFLTRFVNKSVLSALEEVQIEKDLLSETIEGIKEKLDKKVQINIATVVELKMVTINEVLFRGIRKTYSDWETPEIPIGPSEYVYELLFEIVTCKVLMAYETGELSTIGIIDAISRAMGEFHKKQRIFGVGGLRQLIIDIEVLRGVFGKSLSERAGQYLNQALETAMSKCKESDKLPSDHIKIDKLLDSYRFFFIK